MRHNTAAEPAWEGQPAHTIRMLTVPQVAERLGLSHAKVWAMTASGELESVKIDRSRRIPDVAVDDYIAGLRAAAAAQRGGSAA